MKQWIISQLECKPKESDLSDVVIVCHWRRQAQETIEGKDYFADVYGSVGLPAPSGEFTPYADLTFDQVCGWLQELLDVQALDANLDFQIAEQVNPKVIVLPLPWAPQVSDVQLQNNPAWSESPTPVSNVETSSTSDSAPTDTAQPSAQDTPPSDVAQ